MASSKLRNSSFLPNLVLFLLNLLLFLFSSVSLIPIFLLRNPPTSFGWALAVISALTLLASLAGFYSQLTHCCFSTHTTLVLTCLVGQALSFFALFLREERSLEMLGSHRNVRETRFLFRVEECLLLAMFVLQSLALMLSCVIQSCWVREYEGMEVEKEEMTRKRRRRMAQVQEESMVNATMAAEMKAKEIDEKMKNRYGQWAKTDLEAGELVESRA